MTCDTVDSGVAVGQGCNLTDVFWKGAGMVGSIGARKLMGALNTVFSGEGMVLVFLYFAFSLIITCLFLLRECSLPL